MSKNTHVLDNPSDKIVNWCRHLAGVKWPLSETTPDGVRDQLRLRYVMFALAKFQYWTTDLASVDMKPNLLALVERSKAYKRLGDQKPDHSHLVDGIDKFCGAIYYESSTSLPGATNAARKAFWDLGDYTNVYRIGEMATSRLSKGSGRALIEHLQHKAAEADAMIVVGATNGSAGFYQKMGFRPNPYYSLIMLWTA